MRKLFLFTAMLFGFANAQTYLPLQDFSTATGTTPPAGWTNTSYGVNPNANWQFVTAKPGCLPTELYGDGAAFPFAVIGNSFYAEAMDTKLGTPAFSTLGSTYASLEFSELFRGQIGNTYSIDYSTDGGTTWALLAAREPGQYINESNPNTSDATHTLIPLPAAAQNKASVKIRFAYKTHDANFYWAIDNVKVGERAPATIKAIGGFWLDASTWVGGIIPSYIDNVIIPDASLVLINGSPKVHDLTVGEGASGTLFFRDYTLDGYPYSYNSLTVNGNLITNPGSNFDPEYNFMGKRVFVKGNITLNGTSDFSLPNTSLILTGTSQQTISGTGNLGGLTAPIRVLDMTDATGVTINRLITVTEEADMGCAVTNGANLIFDNTRTNGIDSVVLVKYDNNNFSNPILVGPTASYHVKYFSKNDVSPIAVVTGNEIPANNSISSFSIGNSAGLTVNKNLLLTSPNALHLYFGIVTINAANTVTCTNSAYDGQQSYYGSFIQGGDLVLTCAGTSNKTFPLGTNGQARSITFNNLKANGTMAAKVFNSSAGGPGVNLVSLSATRRWYAHMLTGTFTSAFPVVIQYGDDDNFGQSPLYNRQIGFSTTLNGSYASMGSHNDETSSTIQTYSTQTALGYFALGLNSAGMPLLWTGNAGTNNWGDAFNWNTNNVPTSNDEVILDGPITMNLASGTGNYAAKYLTVRSGVTLNSTLANTLTVGLPTGNNSFMKVDGNFNMSNGTIKVKGNAAFGLANQSTLQFNMSGGQLIIDGNDAGKTATSVDAYTPMLALSTYQYNTFSSINGTGGTITIVDANANPNSTAHVLDINTNSSNTSINLSGTTFAFGDGVSVDVGQSQGFVFQTGFNYNSTPLGNVIVDTRADGNGYRYVSTAETNFGASDIKGNLSIKPNGEIRTYISQTYNYTDTAAPLIVGGNIINNGTIRIFNANFGRLILGNSIFSSGNNTVTTPQIVSGPGGWSTSLYYINGITSSLGINNKGGATLNVPMFVEQDLSLIKGALTTSATNLLTHGDFYYNKPGTLTIDSGYVAGPLKRFIPAAAFSDSTGLFPIGTANYYRPAKIDFTTAPNFYGAITATFIETDPGKNGIPLSDNGVTVNRVAKEGYWELTTDGITDGVYNASFTGTGFSGIITPAELRVIKRPTASDPWAILGNHVAGAGFTARRSGLTGFSQFTIASTSANILPVTLLNFKGERNGAINKLSWATTTEVNNAGFELQRSTDGLYFNQIAFINSAAPNGNSSTLLNYLYSDEKRLTGDNYYRLKQIDRDGTATFSNVVYIKAEQASSFEITAIYPNPVVDALHINITSPAIGQINTTLMDINGKLLNEKIITLASGSNTLTVDVSRLSKGTYLLKITDAAGTSGTKKFIKY